MGCHINIFFAIIELYNSYYRKTKYIFIYKIFFVVFCSQRVFNRRVLACERHAIAISIYYIFCDNRYIELHEIIAKYIYIYNRPQDDIEGQHRLPSFFGDNLELYNSITKPQDQNIYIEKTFLWSFVYSLGIL